MVDKPQRTISRRPSREPSASPHRINTLHNDEPAIESFGVSDGFRPAHELRNFSSTFRNDDSRSSTFQDFSSPPREAKKKQSISNGISQPLISRNSFSLRHDAQYSDAPRRMPSVSTLAEQNGTLAARPASILSRQSTYARPQSTYTGPSAPSHPYGMYPQNATELLPRASVTSNTRLTRERSYNGADRPTHPYAMYPQNTASDHEDESLGASTDIASVGFPGLNQQYARRLGPDGEEADDIIGPDGHTEQLPPYTRYPDAGPAPRKEPTQSRLQGMATPSSSTLNEPLNTANSATSMSDTLLSPRGNPIGNARTSRYDSSRSTRDRWTEKSKKKTCFGRLPMWAVALIIFSLIAMGAVMGGVIGRLLVKSKASSGDRNVQATPTDAPATSPSTTSSAEDVPSFGAVPLPTTYTGPLTAPTGSYTLTVPSANDRSATCLAATQQRAWLCMRGPTKLGINVQNPMTSGATVELTGPDPGVNPLLYGDQYPVIQGQVTGSYNLDPEARDLGATLYFHAKYDKQILLRHDDIKPPPSRRSISVERDTASAVLEPRQNRKIAEQDLVWNCIWPDTDMDGFIYVNEPTNGDAPTTTTATSTQPTTTSVTKRGTSRLKRVQSSGVPYTRKVKIVEYRKEITKPATCTLMQYWNGTLVPPLSPQSTPTVIALDESEPPKQKSIIPNWRHDSGKYHTRGDDPDGFCLCEWIVT